MARGNSSPGTSSGVSACCAGIWNARTPPSTSDTPNSRLRESAPSACAASSVIATPVTTIWQTEMMRPRCR